METDTGTNADVDVDMKVEEATEKSIEKQEKSEKSQKSDKSKNEVQSVDEVNEHGIGYNNYKGFWSLQVYIQKNIYESIIYMCLIHL